VRLRNESHNLVYLPESKIPLDEKLPMLKLAGNGVLGDYSRDVAVKSTGGKTGK
jgi:hypothetical protein